MSGMQSQKESLFQGRLETLIISDADKDKGTEKDKRSDKDNTDSSTGSMDMGKVGRYAVDFRIPARGRFRGFRV